jgi:hypothetical protein
MSANRKSRALSGASLGVLATLLLAAPASAQPVQLGPVSVNGDADKNGLNHAPPLASMPSASIQDTPQAVNVIDSATIKQQAVTTLGEALRNVPGITIAIGEGGTLAGDQFRIRGPRNARHPVNAMLNYGYGILANNLRGQIIAAGLDPTIGIIHHSAAIHMPLVCDLMEPLRPEIDRVVLEFGLAHTFTPGDFTINKLGGCRLNPQVARAVAGLAARVEVGAAVKCLIAELQ